MNHIQVHTTVYIDSGRKNAMYTLRQSRTGGMHHIDMYLHNLSNDPVKAEAKARAWFDRVYADRVDPSLYHFEGFADFELNEWGGPNQWEREAIHMITEDGIIPFGKNKGEKIADLEDSYIMWWSKQDSDKLVGQALIEIMKLIAEERGLYEKERKEKADREANRLRTQATADVPITDERIQITGEVVGIKMVEGYGWNAPDVMKIIVLDDRGFKLYGSCPSSVGSAERGDRLEFMARIESSNDDSQFGFFSRPTKSVFLEAAA